MVSVALFRTRALVDLFNENLVLSELLGTDISRLDLSIGARFKVPIPALRRMQNTAYRPFAMADGGQRNRRFVQQALPH